MATVTPCLCETFTTHMLRSHPLAAFQVRRSSDKGYTTLNRDW